MGGSRSSRGIPRLTPLGRGPARKSAFSVRSIAPAQPTRMIRDSVKAPGPVVVPWASFGPERSSGAQSETTAPSRREHHPQARAYRARCGDRKRSWNPGARPVRQERAHLSAKTIANLLTLLIAMFKVAKDVRWLPSVPRIREPRFDHTTSTSGICVQERRSRELSRPRAHSYVPIADAPLPVPHAWRLRCPAGLGSRTTPVHCHSQRRTHGRFGSE